VRERSLEKREVGRGERERVEAERRLARGDSVKRMWRCSEKKKARIKWEGIEE
jgi:hypothetical protein